MRRAAGGLRFRCRTAAGIAHVLLAAALSGWPGVPQADALRPPVLGVDVVREKAEAFIRAQGRDPGRYRLESCRYDYVTGEWTLLFVPPDASFGDYFHLLVDSAGRLSVIE